MHVTLFANERADQCAERDAHLEDNLLHLLIGRLELPNQDDHHLPGVVVCIHGVHERDDEANGLEESRQHLQEGFKLQSRTLLRKRALAVKPGDAFSFAHFPRHMKHFLNASGLACDLPSMAMLTEVLQQGMTQAALQASCAPCHTRLSVTDEDPRA